MLLEFKTKNFKSFCDELIFSMVPAPKQKGLDFSIRTQKIRSKVYKGLSTAVIYGPNASGKTNIISAMDAFKEIVLRGHIRNEEDKDSPNAAANFLELIPNKDRTDQKPIAFSIRFIEKGLLIDYSFSADIGDFLENDYPRKIVSETLSINEHLIFNRNKELIFDDFSSIKEYLVNEFLQNKESAIILAKNNQNDEELFLMNGFKNMFSSKLTALISDWLDNRLMVIYRADSLQTVRKFSEPDKKSIYIEKTLNEAAGYFGIASNALGYVSANDGSESKLFSLFEESKKGKRILIPAELFESYGTIRFVNMFPLVVKAILNGGTLVIDEFDASIHPMALMSIINIFHNDDINTKDAQLIFNTHNPIFLNANLFRRDEIKFVERDEERHCSVQYSLSDFGTSGKNGVRANEDYMKNYFISRYGAIKEIDFTPIFEKLLETKKGE